MLANSSLRRKQEYGGERTCLSLMRVGREDRQLSLDDQALCSKKARQPRPKPGVAQAAAATAARRWLSLPPCVTSTSIPCSPSPFCLLTAELTQLLLWPGHPLPGFK